MHLLYEFATFNINPGLTDGATTFVSGESKDTGNTTGSITLASDAFTEIEFSVQALAAATDGGDYCFRLYDATNSQVLDTYSVYSEVQLGAPPTDVTVSASGTQTASMFIPSTDQYVGGKFVIIDNTGSRNITGITITESGTVDALNNLDNIKLFYELDTTAPYDGASESYAGGELQFGVTDTDGFSAANGTSSFTDTVAIDTTSTLVVYVVFDVGAGATPGEPVEISINDPSTEVTASAGTVGPATPVAIPGTTTLTAAVTVSASGTQTASMAIPSTNQYVGGKFVIVDNTGSRNITGITITESGTVDALNNLDNIKLFYELDSTAPYDGASESYAGTESQFGVTDTTGFSAANGTSSFTDTVAINTTSTLCDVCRPRCRCGCFRRRDRRDQHQRPLDRSHSECGHGGAGNAGGDFWDDDTFGGVWRRHLLLGGDGQHRPLFGHRLGVGRDPHVE